MVSQDLLYSHIGEQLKSHREKRNLTQHQLAALVALERTSITNIERGRQKLPLHVLFNICDVLRVSPSEILPRASHVREEQEMEQVTLGTFTGQVPPGIAKLLNAS